MFIYFSFSPVNTYLCFPCNLGSVSVGITIIPIPTFNVHCFYSLLLPCCSPFYLICFLSSLSILMDSLKTFGINVFLYPYAYLSCTNGNTSFYWQDSGITNHHQNTLEVSLSLLFPLHSPLLWFYYSHLSYY